MDILRKAAGKTQYERGDTSAYRQATAYIGGSRKYLIFGVPKPKACQFVPLSQGSRTRNGMTAYKSGSSAGVALVLKNLVALFSA